MTIYGNDNGLCNFAAEYYPSGARGLTGEGLVAEYGTDKAELWDHMIVVLHAGRFKWAVFYNAAETGAWDNIEDEGTFEHFWEQLSSEEQRRLHANHPHAGLPKVRERKPQKVLKRKPPKVQRAKQPPMVQRGKQPPKVQRAKHTAKVQKRRSPKGQKGRNRRA